VLQPCCERCYYEEVTETYTVIGYDANWTTAAVVVVVTAIQVPFTKAARRRGIVLYGLAAAALLLLGVVAGLPENWAFAGCAVGLTTLAFIRNRSSMPRWGIAVGAAFTLAVAASFVFMVRYISNEQIVLGEGKVAFDQFGDRKSIARNGLTIHATGSPRQWWQSRAFSSWTTYGPNETLGPDITGFAIYWGPHGLIRGDDLGKKLAEWAGTKPVYRQVALR
jgi:hypothetical protein